ncbi:hypothetical protein GOBAR_DD26507 [Gossypium barbadense]|nr:hypothetical protein GOBAR_DD26507 [Gossypium barbadense]
MGDCKAIVWSDDEGSRFCTLVMVKMSYLVGESIDFVQRGSAQINGIRTMFIRAFRLCREKVPYEAF